MKGTAQNGLNLSPSMNNQDNHAQTCPYTTSLDNSSTETLFPDW